MQSSAFPSLTYTRIELCCLVLSDSVNLTVLAVLLFKQSTKVLSQQPNYCT